jgi:peptidoglycan hydrolase-like protein with peptidoglycan-binding domain
MSNGQSKSAGSLEAFGNDVVNTLRSVFWDKLIIRLLDSDDNPRPGVAYVLKVGGRVYKDKTDSTGILSHRVPDGSTTGTLTFEDQDVTLNIGALPAPGTIAGLQTRLNNMGYPCGAAGGTMNDKTEQAIRRFQNQHKVTVDGKASTPTMDKAKEVYGH